MTAGTKNYSIVVGDLSLVLSDHSFRYVAFPFPSSFGGKFQNHLRCLLNNLEYGRESASIKLYILSILPLIVKDCLGNSAATRQLQRIVIQSGVVPRVFRRSRTEMVSIGCGCASIEFLGSGDFLES